MAKVGFKLPEEDRQRILDKLAQRGWTTGQLIGEVEAHTKKKMKTAIYNLFKPDHKTTTRTLEAVAETLDMDFPNLIPQLHFEFKITHEFVQEAQRALAMERGDVVLRGTLRTKSTRRDRGRSLMMSRVSMATTTNSRS